ncbi:MAG: hypothetical protein COS85_18365 [Armatimonadetes bacterium CG07_land_8_20_14_0_80_59_28]|nr:MAG: hypothetical protein COS85_18365 [Armatimonadetes bacterium CG07_land_8_20_14_0_80_59_28]
MSGFPLRSNIRPFAHSLIRPFAHSLIRPFAHSSIRPFAWRLGKPAKREVFTATAPPAFQWRSTGFWCRGFRRGRE